MAFNCNSKAILLQARFLIRMVKTVWITLLNSISCVGLKTTVHEEFQAGYIWPSPKRWDLGSQRQEILPLQQLFLPAGLRGHFSQLRKRGKAWLPPQQHALSAGQGGLTSLPRAVGEPLDLLHLLAGSTAAGKVRAGHPGYAILATSPTPRALTLGRAARCSWGCTALVQAGLQPHSQAVPDWVPDTVSLFLGTRPGASSLAFVKC